VPPSVSRRLLISSDFPLRSGQGPNWSGEKTHFFVNAWPIREFWRWLEVIEIFGHSWFPKSVFPPHLHKIDWNTKKHIITKYMVYMNLEGKWSLTTPLMGLGCAWSYYENFRRSSRLFLNKKITWRSILKTDYLCHLRFLIFTGCNYFLTPQGSLGTNLSSHGTPGNHFLTPKQFK